MPSDNPGNMPIDRLNQVASARADEEIQIVPQLHQELDVIPRVVTGSDLGELDTPSPVTQFERLTVSALRDYARQRNIDLPPGRTKKSALIELIHTAEATT